MKKHPILIETQRLLIRPFELGDIEAAHTMNLDPEVSAYTGDGGIVSREETERRIKEDVLGDYATYGYGRWAVIWKENGQFIGFSGLKYIPELNEVDLGYRFLSAYWGKGIATEAAKACIAYSFERLALNRLIAWVLPENAGSIRVLEKSGFRFEKEVEEDGQLAHQYALHKPS